MVGLASVGLGAAEILCIPILASGGGWVDARMLGAVWLEVASVSWSW